MSFQPWFCCWSKHRCFFFSLWAFLLEVLLLPAGKELDGFGTKSGRHFSTRFLQESWIEKVYDLAMVESASWLPCRQCWSLSHKINGGCRLTFALASIAFLTNSSQLSCSRLRCSIWAFIDGLRPLRKNQIRSDSSGALSSSNSWRID